MSADLYAETTARIVAALEQGVAPWVRPWSTGVDTLPMNAQTGRAYRGINVVLLAMESQRQGYALDRWLTYRQATELGGQVRRGERGSTVVFWRLRKLSATADAYPHEREDDVPEQVIPLLRAYTVFNVAQVDGLPSEVHAVAETHLGARGPGRGAAPHVRSVYPPWGPGSVLPAWRR